MTIKDGIKLGIGLVIGRKLCNIISETLRKIIVKNMYIKLMNKSHPKKILLLWDFVNLKRWIEP